MLFLSVLLLFYGATWLLRRRCVQDRDRWRLALGGAMVIAGVMHLLQPEPFVQHLPVWVPERELLVATSGLAEVGLGVEIDGQPGGLYPWLRLMFQPLFVWLAVWSTRAPSTVRAPREVAR